MTEPVTDDELLLTDDEVVAIAEGLRIRWPGGAPTVDDAGDAIEAAAFRGNRSLLIRRHRTAGPDDVARLVEELAAARGRITAYVADDRSMRASWGIASTHYATGASWVLETVNGVGIHRFVRDGIDAHRAYLVALLDAVVALAPETDDERLCVLAQGDGGAILCTARRGIVDVGGVEVVDGTPQPTESVTVVTPEQAVERLVAVVASA
jgi:hypothetical protein